MQIFEMNIYYAIKMVLYGTLCLTLGLSLLGGLALWRFFKQRGIPGYYQAAVHQRV